MALIEIKNGKMKVPDKLDLAYMEGDGIGPDITRATLKVLDACVKRVYGGRRSITWVKLDAGEEAFAKEGNYMPDSTIEAIKHYHVALKGPLTTPVGKGIRSINVLMRQTFDMYANIRPVKFFPGLPSPLKNPENVDITVVRENTEDVYAGIEFAEGSAEARGLIKVMKEQFKILIKADAGIGIKVITESGTRRIMEKAITYALDHKKDRIVIMHKGNIMKFTEGAFMNWCYDVAKKRLGSKLITEQELTEKYDGKVPEGMMLVNDRIADNMLQQIITRPEDYSVIVAPNLNGDYVSDAIAAEVGGLGVAPGGNIGDEYAIFEAVHGSAPKYANKNIANPTSMILAGAMMFAHLGWKEAHDAIYEAVENAMRGGALTQDLARVLNVKALGTSEFADAVIKKL
jgi:isocitrate dehydrogenase